MPTANQKSDTLQAIEQIRQAQALINAQLELCADTEGLIELNRQLQMVDGLISELIHAQNAANDELFTKATSSLKQQVTDLKADAEKTKTCIDTIENVAKYVGYITQAFKFIARL